MHTYCKLKNGDIVIVWSDNVEQETIAAYLLERKDDFDIEFDSLITNIPYSDIERTDTDLSYLQNL
jgi:hypothetical protein